ncbi:MAG: DUF2993 domain-containing protein [Pelosinus sp.]|nr:DUF2993 domain-containing protein [Pelosinus sp.]
MIKRLVMLFVVIAGLAALSEAVLPSVASELISQGLASQTGSEAMQTTAEKHPAVYMLGGQFDKLAIQGTNIKMERIVISELRAKLTDVQVDMNALLQQRKIGIKSVKNIDLTAVLTQEELAACLNKSVKGVKNAAVSITPDKVKVTSNFAVGGLASLAVTLEGRIVSDGEKIKFVTQNFSLNNRLMGSIGGAALTEIPLFEVKKLPFHVSVRDIVMENGRVIINALN